MANIILSLRTISEQNWNEFFEAVSRVEKALRKDPAGVYSLMDFTTRDLYRKEIEILSTASGRDELDLVQNTLALARENNEGQSKPSRMSQGIFKEGDSPLGSSSHVGEYLLGKSRHIIRKTDRIPPEPKSDISTVGAASCQHFLPRLNIYTHPFDFHPGGASGRKNCRMYRHLVLCSNGPQSSFLPWRFLYPF